MARSPGRSGYPELLYANALRPGCYADTVKLEPFISSLIAPQQANARDYVEGLLSDLKSKDAESIAYLHDRERQGIQKFIGQADWDHGPLIAELARQVGQELGESDAVLVFDPSAFPKCGTKSVGVARQW